MVLTLYKMDASPPVRSVYMVIEALNIQGVKYVDTNLLADEHMTEDFLKLNPQHTIPLLTDDDFVVWDSHAIVTYLLNQYGKDSPLYPNDPKKRALIDNKLHFDTGILYPALRENDEPIFFWNDPTLKPEGIAKIKAAYDFTNSFLANSPWLAGNEVTVADICCVATISSLNEIISIDEDDNRMVLTLYKMDASPPVRSVYMVIEALNIRDVKYVEIDLLANEHMTEDFLKLNPQHTVPLLTDDDLVVWDSHAIVTYLLNKYGKDSPLYPNDPKKRALIDNKLHFDTGILYPAFRENDEPIFFWNEPTLKPAGIVMVQSAYEFTDTFLANSQWLAGNEVTVADICCVATISSLNEIIPIDEEKYPNVIAWLNRCSELDFYKKGNVKGLLEYGQYLKEYMQRDAATS